LKIGNAQKEMMNGTVYLIHLEIKISHAQHYIGWAKWFKERIKHHRNGTGAKFLAEAARRGIGLKLSERGKTRTEILNEN